MRNTDLDMITHVRNHYWLSLILLLAVCLRFYNLDFQSAWCDEVLSMVDSNPADAFKKLYTNVLYWEQMPHLYFYLLRFVFEAFGFTVLVGRAFSAIIGVLGVYGVYLLGKELYDKRAGLLAALLLSVNAFHIMYSQEMRPYGMFFLFTVLSFYRLVILIKRPSTRHAVYYGIFTGLLINSHLFGMVTIFAQCLLLLAFLLRMPSDARKPFFIKCCIGGGIVLLLTIPVFKPMSRAMEMESFWLGPPTPTVYGDMMREFFGRSEMVLFAVQVLLLFFILLLFRQKQKGDVRENKLLFTAIILSGWLLVTLLVPIIKSYLDISMIVNRYFIGIVAVLVIAIAVAIRKIANKPMQVIVILYFTVFSLVDLFVVRKYYTTISKTQFRELTVQIRAQNHDKSKIVAYWSRLFAHFFQDDPAVQIEQSDLENYIGKMRLGNLPPAPFWYADANARPYQLSPEAQAYLDSHYKLIRNIELFDAWARHYVPIAGKAGS